MERTNISADFSHSKRFRYQGDWNRYIHLPRRTLAPVEDVAAYGDAPGTGGYPIAFDPDTGEMSLANSRTEHTIAVGRTGCGKTTSLIIPTVLDMARAGKSFVVPDMAGNLYANNPAVQQCLREQGYKVYVLDFIGYNGNGFNLFHRVQAQMLTGDYDAARDTCAAFMEDFITQCDPNPKDPFWRDNAKLLISSCARLVVNRAQHRRDPASIAALNLATLDDLTSESSRSPMMRICEMLPEEERTPLLRDLYSILGLSENTRHSVYSTLNGYFSRFKTNPAVMRMLSTTDFEPLGLLNPRTCLFITIPSGSQFGFDMASMVMNEVLNALKDYAVTHGGRLEHQVTFILDEVANLHPARLDLTLSTVRNFNIRCILACQGLEQLESVYGPQVSAILANCATVILWGGCGEAGTLRILSNRSGTVNGEPLVTADDLYSISPGEAYFSSDFGQLQYVTQMIGCYKMESYRKLEEKGKKHPPSRQSTAGTAKPVVCTANELASEMRKAMLNQSQAERNRCYFV